MTLIESVDTNFTSIYHAHVCMLQLIAFMSPY